MKKYLYILSLVTVILSCGPEFHKKEDVKYFDNIDLDLDDTFFIRLVLTKGKLKGTTIHEGKVFDITGSIESNGELTLIETNKEIDQTGMIKGTIAINDDNRWILNGFWSKADGETKKKDIKLFEGTIATYATAKKNIPTKDKLKDISINKEPSDLVQIGSKTIKKVTQFGEKKLEETKQKIQETQKKIKDAIENPSPEFTPKESPSGTIGSRRNRGENAPKPPQKTRGSRRDRGI